MRRLSIKLPEGSPLPLRHPLVVLLRHTVEARFLITRLEVEALSLYPTDYGLRMEAHLTIPAEAHDPELWEVVGWEDVGPSATTNLITLARQK